MSYSPKFADRSLNFFQEVIRHGFLHMTEVIDPTSLVYTNLDPFGKSLKVVTEFNKARKLREVSEKEFGTFENLVKEFPRKWNYGVHGYTTFKMNYFLYPRTQQLCRGEYVRIIYFVFV